MPELSDALHELYEEESRSFTTPSRGLNVLAAQARGARRRTVAKSAGLSVVGVAAVGGLVFGSLQVFGGPGDVLPPGTSASAPSIAPPSGVAWDPWTTVADAMGFFPVPQCGEPFAPDAVAVGGVIPTPFAALEVDEEGEPLAFWVGDGFMSQTDTATEFLALQSSVIFTQDGLVVGTADFLPENLELYNSSVDPSTGSGFSGRSTCARAEAWEAEIGDAFDNYGGLDAAAQAELDARAQAFSDAWQALPSGDYVMYAVTPIIFGEQLAVAHEIKAMGVPSLGILTADLGSTSLADDPRIAFYCAPVEGADPGSGNAVVCNPPVDVLQAVLTFEIDESTIVDIPSGVAISEPVYLTVP